MPQVLQELRTHAQKAAPQECCGLLLGQGGQIEAVVPSANVAADPLTQFEIDPRVLIDAWRTARAGGPEIVGYYHSHPVGAPEPSPCDRDQAAGDGKVWAIVGRRGEVRFWRDEKTGFTALSYSPEGA